MYQGTESKEFLWSRQPTKEDDSWDALLAPKGIDKEIDVLFQLFAEDILQLLIGLECVDQRFRGMTREEVMGVRVEVDFGVA